MSTTTTIHNDVRTVDHERQVVLRYVVSRFFVVAVASLGLVVGHDASGPWPSYDGPSVFGVLGRWDGAWYVSIASGGYPSDVTTTANLAKYAFFPLFPTSVGLLSHAGLSPLFVGLVISTLAGGVASVLVYRLALHYVPAPIALRAATLFAFLPGSFVFSMPYAEGLLVVGCAACLLFLEERRWVVAGLAGCLAVTARPTGAAIIIPCALCALAAIRKDDDWRALAAPASPTIARRSARTSICSLCPGGRWSGSTRNERRGTTGSRSRRSSITSRR